MTKRKQYSPDEKVALLRRHFLDHIPVSDLCEEQQLHPNVFYRWQKSFFEGGVAAFEKDSSRQLSRLQKQISELEAQLSRKNEVLAEVTEAYVRLKKNSGAL